jgi:hypothetical protein
MTSIGSSFGIVSSRPASAASPTSKRKRDPSSSEAASASIVPIQSPALNVLTFLANRQITPNHLSVQRSQSQIHSQVITKHLLNKTFNITKIDIAPMTFTSNHDVGGKLKVVTVGCTQDESFQHASIIKIFEIRQLRLESEIHVDGHILKVLHLTNWLITVIAYLNTPSSHSRIVTYDLRNGHLIKSIDASLLNVTHVCIIGKKFFFMKNERELLVEFDENREEKLMEIDSQVIVRPPRDKVDSALRRFIFLSSNSYIIRAARLEMAITDLKDLTRNVKVNISLLIESYYESDEASASVAKKRRSASSEVQAHGASSSSGSSAARTDRAITAAHLDGHLLYFGISNPKGEIEIGLIDLDSKKVVKMYSLTHNFADRVNQVFVSQDHSWLCFGDKLGQIGIVDLKSGLSSYLGRHSTIPMPDILDINGVSHFDLQGEFLVSRGEDGFKIWNLKTQTEIYKKESPISKPFFYEDSLYFHKFGPGEAVTFTKFDLLSQSTQEDATRGD